MISGPKKACVPTRCIFEVGNNINQTVPRLTVKRNVTTGGETIHRHVESHD
jgi:hypothetical protein